MRVHLITYEYFNKNTPRDIVHKTIVVPRATSAEARHWFWYHILVEDPDIISYEIDSLKIVLVQSREVV